MSDWALASGFRAESFNVATGSTGGVSTLVTSSATANTKGSWSQLFAATSFDATALLLHVSNQFNDTKYLVDIGLGAAGSEIVIAPNLLFGLATGVCVSLLLPLAVPAGSRVAARSQDNFGSSVSYISGTLLAGGWMGLPAFSSLTDYGTATASSGGTTADAGGTANTKGSYVQLTASTTYAHKGLMIAAMRPTPGTSMSTDYIQAADVAIGAAGSEKIIIPDLRFVASVMTGGVNTPYTAGSATLSGRGTVIPEYTPIIPCDIPAGSRIAVRQSSSSVQATDRTCAYTAYGVN